MLHVEDDTNQQTALFLYYMVELLSPSITRKRDQTVISCVIHSFWLISYDNNNTNLYN